MAAAGWCFSRAGVGPRWRCGRDDRRSVAGGDHDPSCCAAAGRVEWSGHHSCGAGGLRTGCGGGLTREFSGLLSHIGFSVEGATYARNGRITAWFVSRRSRARAGAGAPKGAMGGPNRRQGRCQRMPGVDAVPEESQRCVVQGLRHRRHGAVPSSWYWAARRVRSPERQTSRPVGGRGSAERRRGHLSDRLGGALDQAGDPARREWLPGMAHWSPAGDVGFRWGDRTPAASPAGAVTCRGVSRCPAPDL